MKVVFRFDGSEALSKRVAALGVEMCPESDGEAYARLLPQIEVLWHVLKPVMAEQIGKAKKLRLIQKIGTGVNTIDIEAAKRRGIAVCNLPGTNSRAVAEMTLLLMLACLRRLTELHSSVKGHWADAWKLQDRFGELGGRTVGLVGYGAVPQLLAPLLNAMGAKVLYCQGQRRTQSSKHLSRHPTSCRCICRSRPKRRHPRREEDESRRDPGEYGARRPVSTCSQRNRRLPVTRCCRCRT